jgi:hypothetical protein
MIRSLPLRLLCVIALHGLGGCAALIARTGTDEAQLIHPGTTESELAQRLGSAIRSADLSPPRRALELWQSDHGVALLAARDVAVSESTYPFRHTLGKDSRAVQASFGSFNDDRSRAVAYRWAAAPKR